MVEGIGFKVGLESVGSVLNPPHGGTYLAVFNDVNRPCQSSQLPCCF